MKNRIIYLIILIFLTLIPENGFSQVRLPGTDIITSSDLESYVTFLASPLLKGRKNGEPGLEIAQQYLASQAKLLGLLPANGSSYYQPYSIVNSAFDSEKTQVRVIQIDKDTVTILKPIYQWEPYGPSDFTLEGEVVFAGYGIKREIYAYNDFNNIRTEGKIVLIMTGAPPSIEGEKSTANTTERSQFKSIQEKVNPLVFSHAKAILIVIDPKSGYSSLEEQYPNISENLNSSEYLKNENRPVIISPNLPRIMFVHRSVAEELLAGTGFSLAELQEKIDRESKPYSFDITGKQIIINGVIEAKERIMNNIAAYIEGSDPVLKNEYIVFSGHADHIGETAEGINPGADDDASGCAALISMAKAFSSLEKKPLRSILFLWVSGEEIGLYGSQAYINSPLVPLDKTVVDLNMDMIGRVKGVADTSEENPMTGPDKVFVITDHQSKELLSVAKDIDKTTRLDFDYSLSGKNHPLQLFTRSDHYNFVKADIPVLFFTSGLHTDYHTPADVPGKIDFKKLELVTRTMYQIGYTVANSKTRIVVDNPFSKW